MIIKLKTKSYYLNPNESIESIYFISENKMRIDLLITLIKNKY